MSFNNLKTVISLCFVCSFLLLYRVDNSVRLATLPKSQKVPRNSVTHVFLSINYKEIGKFNLCLVGLCFGGARP